MVRPTAGRGRRGGGTRAGMSAGLPRGRKLLNYIPLPAPPPSSSVAAAATTTSASASTLPPPDTATSSGCIRDVQQVRRVILSYVRRHPFYVRHRAFLSPTVAGCPAPCVCRTLDVELPHLQQGGGGSDALLDPETRKWRDGVLFGLFVVDVHGYILPVDMVIARVPAQHSPPLPVW